MKIAIFGSGGLLGSDLVAIGKSKSYSLLTYHRDVDIAKRELVRARLRADLPSWVVNTAGESNVDVAEKNPSQAFAVNQIGAKNVADVCAELDIPVVHISTDYVFAGKPNHLYFEDEARSAINVYGQSKAAGEEEVSRVRKHYILRVSSLFGKSRANHALRVIDAIRTNAMVKIASDMICSPTNTVHLAEMIYALIEKQPAFGIYHAVTKNSCSRLAFAQEICRQLHVKASSHIEEIEIISVGLPAKRPDVLQLSTAKWQNLIGPIHTWQEGLEKFIFDLKK